MSDISESAEMGPIDYDAIGRMGNRWRWKEDPRAKTEAKTFPISKDSNPNTRIEAQGILLTEVEESETQVVEGISLDGLYRKYDQAERNNAERQAEKRSKRATDVHLRDLEVQQATLNPEHEMYSVLERVGKRISEAEKRLTESGSLTRTTPTEEYSFYVTKRENINAYTYPQKRTVFFESGIVTLMDDYLKDSKGYGLAEDHIALLLAHEVSHSDPEAETGYLNEEYCDVQGMILGAEAGYNPAAAVDVEDFLIWLDEGSNKYKDGEEDKEKERQNAFIPSHPDPQHRRLVLINVLKDNTRVLPNQTKQLTFVESEVIDDVDKQKTDWQSEVEKRALPVSGEEALQQIEESSNLTELLDSLMGEHLRQKAELTRQIMSDQRFVDKVTLYQAISAELRAGVGDGVSFRIEGKDNMPSDISTVVITNRYGSEGEAYDSSDVVIGGLSRQLEEIPSQEQDKTMAQKIRAESLNDLGQVSAKVRVRSEANWDATEEEKSRADRNAKMEGFILTEKVSRLLKYVGKKDGEIDLPRLLSGDFTEDETLATLLDNLGIKNFDNYLLRIRKNFQGLDPNERVKSTLAERTTNLFVNPDVLVDIEKNRDREHVSALLDETLPYRMAKFAERNVDKDQQSSYIRRRIQLSDELKEKVGEKLREFSSGFSVVPQEQEMYYQLMNGIVTGERLPSDIEKQIAASTSVSGQYSSRKIEERFETPGLAEVVKRLRVAPMMGGDLLRSYIKGPESYNDRTGYDQIKSTASFLGREFDFIRLYYGECEFEESDNEDYWRREVRFKVKERDSLGNLELVARRKNEIPVYGGDIEEFDLEKGLQFVEEEVGEGEKGFDLLKEAARVSEYEKRYLEEIVTFKGVGVEQRTAYLMSAIENGEFSFSRLYDVLKMDEYSVEAEEIDKEREKYQVAMTMLRQLPVNPIPQMQGFDGSRLNESLFAGKLKHAKYDKLLERKREESDEEIESLGYVQSDEVWGVDLFEDLSEQEREKARFDMILDFVDEGGSVSISSGGGWERYSHGNSVYWAEMRNSGANLDLVGIVGAMEYPTDYIKERVDNLLEKNKERFSGAERDKWMSLAAYSQQPDLYGASNRWSYSDKNKNFKLKEDGRFRECDAQNIDHLLVTLDQVVQMPRCSYRDYCLEQLKNFASGAIEYGVPGKKGRTEYLDHPARTYFEQRLGEVLASGFSDQGFGIREESNKVSKGENIHRSFIPASERLSGDAAAGFYVEGTPASKAWQGMVGEHYSGTLHTPLGVEYRDNERFKDMDRGEVEQTVLYDRLRLLQTMPDGQLRESLTLYSLQTAYDNLPDIENSNNFKEELSVLTKKYGGEFESPQAKQRLFEMRLKLETGDLEGEISPTSIRDRFATQQEFLGFITEAIPEKTAYRDSYVLLASEVYPLKVGDAPRFRELMFSVDYGTQDKEVMQQRAGLEVGRVIKQNEKYHPRHARELMMWLVDEDLQVGSFDELLKKLDTSSVGRRLLRGVIKDQGGDEIYEGEDKTLRERLGGVAVKAATETFIRLPYPAKKKIVKEVFKRVKVKQRELAFATRAGMPEVVQLLSEQTGGLGTEYLTYNSLLDSANLENPTVKSMFFDLMLGEKGLLEEPVVTDSESFGERMNNGFDGSEMHRFIDDIVGVIARKGKLGRKEKDVIRAVSHSLIEGMSPTRRATVLHNLMSEIPKIDFSQPDKEELRSQIFTTALSSFGVLGAKLGQTDEVIPDGWGKDASSLKHATEPMPSLAVADIFRQEGLSGEYKILSPAGAASTACGYIVESPTGERQFVKVVRPEVVLDWGEDFVAVEHMLKSLKQTGVVGFETGPVVNQLKRLVEEELQTGKEINNVVQYVSAETEEERQRRGGIRSVKMPLERIGIDGSIVERPEGSLMIFAEPLGEEQGFVELSKIKSDPELSRNYDLERVNTLVVQDFLYRGLELGSWHSDPHEGNIMVSRLGTVRKELTSDDLIWIDFGQTGTVEGEEKRGNAARFLVGLGLYDRDEVARSIYEGLTDNVDVSLDTIKRELSLRPDQLQDSAVKVLAKYEVEEYMTNFLKASINILPYLRDLPREEQFNLISPYIPEDVRRKMRTRLIERVIKR